jgi:hypothetical protein
MARKHVDPLPLSAYAIPGMIGIGDDVMIENGIGAGLQKLCSHAAPHGSPLRACGAIGSVSTRARRAYRTRSTFSPHPLLVSAHDDADHTRPPPCVTQVLVARTAAIAKIHATLAGSSS